MSVSVRHLTPDDVGLMEARLTIFGEAFNEVEIYSGNRPFIALAALKVARSWEFARTYCTLILRLGPEMRIVNK